MQDFTILLVDDVPANLFSLKLLIEDRFEGISILEASSAKEALIEIMKYDIDLILTDIQMPGVSGFELVDYLKDLEETKDIPMMVITGIYEDHLYKKMAFNSSKNIINFFTKPIDDEMFILKLQVFLNNAKRKQKNKTRLDDEEKEAFKKQRILSILNSANKHFDNKIEITKDEIEVFLEPLK